MSEGTGDARGWSNRDVVDQLESVWTSIAALCADFTPEMWAETATGLPRWSVQDVLSHVAGVEALLLGRPMPDYKPANAGTLGNDLAEMNEVVVGSRRSKSGVEVFAEFREVTAERVVALHAMSDEAFAAESWSPLGQSTYRGFMETRIVDTWTHEQDIRRVVHRPGNFDSIAADYALRAYLNRMPMAVSKNAHAPDSTIAVIALTGRPGLSTTVGVENGRGKILDAASPPASPAVRLSFDPETFLSLASGRRFVTEDFVLEQHIAIEGDRQLGRAIVEGLNVMF